MSRRHFLNVSIGATAFLMLIAIGALFANLGGAEDSATRIGLLEDQVGYVDDLNRVAHDLEVAEDFPTVSALRKELGRTILRFDSTLSALLHGGVLADANGDRIEIERAGNGSAQAPLESAAALWRQVGLPLADLAAGQFSIYSASGQQAVKELRASSTELTKHLNDAAGEMELGGNGNGRIATGSRLAAFALGGLLFVLALARFLVGRSPEAPAAPRHGQPLTVPVPGAESAAGAAQAAGTPVFSPPPRPASGFQGFQPPVDFENVNAAVDQMSVDMNTIAGSTDKMRLAIDSVGHALQGMLYSLNEMANDTAEGHKIVHGANNAASYTATAAGELAGAARDMSQLVARVTQLSLKTKQVAAQIDGDAIHTGKTGEAFTSVVANEVKGLAAQTSQATAEIDNTVAEIMATARQYEEAIGQIIKNVAAINKVSQNLGELMLHPPQRPVPGAPLTPQVPAAAPAEPAAVEAPAPVAPSEPAPQAEAPAAPPVAAQEPVQEPAPAPAAAAAEPAAEPETPVAEPVAEEPAAEETPPAEPADPWGGVIDDPVDPEPSPDEVAAETSAAIEETAEEDPDSEPSGSNGNVFMLGGGPKKPRRQPKPKAEPAAAAPEPEPAPEPAPEAQSEPEEEEEVESGSNIFMLQKPKKKKAATAATPPPEPKAEDTTEAADDEPLEEVMIGAPAADADGEKPAEKEEKKPGANIFMLNKKK